MKTKQKCDRKLLKFVAAGICLGLLLSATPNGRGNLSLGIPATVWKSPHDLSYWRSTGSWSLSEHWDYLTYRHRGWEVVAVIELHGLILNLSLGLILSLATYALFRRRLFRSKAGHSPQCRYDLTGNTSGVCPECGLLIPTQEPDSVRLSS